MHRKWSITSSLKRSPRSKFDIYQIIQLWKVDFYFVLITRNLCTLYPLWNWVMSTTECANIPSEEMNTDEPETKKYGSQKQCCHLLWLLVLDCSFPFIFSQTRYLFIQKQLKTLSDHLSVLSALKTFNSSVLTEDVLCCLETICPTNSEVLALKLIHETDDPVFLFMQHLARIPDISLRLDVYNCVVSLSHRLASLKKSVSYTLETLRFLRNKKEISSLLEIILATLNYVGHREGEHPIHSFTIRFLSDLPSIRGDRDIPTLMLFVYSYSVHV